MNLQGFINWATGQGTVAKYDDGQYAGECVSLINQYCYRVLNIPAKAWGHAKDWATNAAPLSYFNKVGDIQAGDILVYGANFGGGYGHIEIAIGGGKALGQNRDFGRRVGVYNILSGYSAILRTKQAPVSTGGGSNKDMTPNFVRRAYYMIQGRNPEQSEVDFHMSKSTPESFINGFGDNPLWLIKSRELDVAYQVRDNTINEKNAAVAARNKAVAEFGVASDKAIELNKKIEQFTAQIANLGIEIAAKNKEIEQLKSAQGSGNARLDDYSLGELLTASFSKLFKIK